MKLLALIFFLMISFQLSAQNSKLVFNFSAGVGAGWWIQESTQEVMGEDVTDWANSRLSTDVQFNTNIKFKFSDILIAGPGIGFKIQLSENLYASSPFVPSFTKTKISDGAITIFQYYISLSTTLLESRKLNFFPTIDIGSFALETIHPDKDHFKGNILFKCEMKIEFNSNEEVIPFLIAYYSNLSFKSDSEQYEKQNHHIQSIGTGLGLRF